MYFIVFLRKKMKRLIINYKFTILLLILAILSFFIGRGNYSFYTTIIRIVLSVIFIISFISLCNKIKLRILSFLLKTIGAVCFCFTFTYLILYKQPISYDVIASMLNTDTQEFLSYLTELSFTLVLPVILFTLYFLSTTELRSHPVISLKNSILLITGTTIIPFFLITGKTFYTHKNKKTSEFFSNLKFTYSLGVNQMLADNISTLNTYNFFGLCLYGNALLQESQNLKKYYKAPKILEEGVEPKKTTSSPNNIILIIGESASLFHFSIYGYKPQTTPFLDSIQNKENILAKYKAITSFQYTRTAVPSILKMDNATTPKSTILETKNIIHLAKNSGYNTYWISNQNISGKYEGEISLLANTCDYTWYSSFNERKEDFNLIKPFSDHYNPSEKQFFIIHLIGSHVSFSDKYDKMDTKYLSDKTNIDQYNCSIHHTDRFLQNIYNEINKPNNADYAMIYLSDHGENPHSTEGRYSKDGYSFFVPFITISNTYHNRMDSICNSYISDKYLNTSNTYYILAEILGYHVTEEVKQNAIKNGNFVKFKNNSQSYTHYTEIPLEKNQNSQTHNNKIDL